jgi:hypothetical protein
VAVGEKMGKKGRNSDLKGSHEKPNTHAIAFVLGVCA